MSSPRWILVVAVAQNDVIGRGDALPWRLSSDLKRFKQRTMGHCLFMGRKTYESIGKPLPGRQTVVLSRSGFQADGVEVVKDIGEVEQVLEPERDIMVVGGGQLYELALERCDELWITRVLATVEGDVTFPRLDPRQWKLQSSEAIPAGPKDEWATEFQIWTRQ